MNVIATDSGRTFNVLCNHDYDNYTAFQNLGDSYESTQTVCLQTCDDSAQCDVYSVTPNANSAGDVRCFYSHYVAGADQTYKADTNGVNIIRAVYSSSSASSSSSSIRYVQNYFPSVPCVSAFVQASRAAARGLPTTHTN